MEEIYRSRGASSDLCLLSVIFFVLINIECFRLGDPLLWWLRRSVLRSVVPHSADIISAHFEWSNRDTSGRRDRSGCHGALRLSTSLMPPPLDGDRSHERCFRDLLPLWGLWMNSGRRPLRSATSGWPLDNKKPRSPLSLLLAAKTAIKWRLFNSDICSVMQQKVHIWDGQQGSEAAFRQMMIGSLRTVPAWSLPIDQWPLTSVSTFPLRSTDLGELLVCIHIEKIFTANMIPSSRLGDAIDNSEMNLKQYLWRN